MNTAERIAKNMDGEWFRILVSQKYQFNRDVQAATEAEIREAGFDWQTVHSAFCWKNLSKDFIREIVESHPIYKTQLEQELLMDLHGYSIHASYFYQNMGYYISNKLAEQRQLSNYVDKIYHLYRQQAEQEYNSGEVVRFTDYSGRVLNMVRI